jgi:hypothetical protein
MTGAYQRGLIEIQRYRTGLLRTTLRTKRSFSCISEDNRNQTRPSKLLLSLRKSFSESGRGGIRTHGALTGTPDIESGPYNLIPSPLHIFEQDLLSAPIIELGGATIGVTGYPLGHFQSAIVF